MAIPTIEEVRAQYGAWAQLQQAELAFHPIAGFTQYVPDLTIEGQARGGLPQEAMGMSNVGIGPIYDLMPVPIVQQGSFVQVSDPIFNGSGVYAPAVEPFQADVTIAPIAGIAGSIAATAVLEYLKKQYPQLIPSLTSGVISWITRNWKWLALAVGASVALALIVKWLLGTGGQPTKKAVKAAGGKVRTTKRYSIGRNPRVGTLLKVAKIVDRNTKQMYARFRHAGLIRQPHRTSYPRIVPVPYRRLPRGRG